MIVSGLPIGIVFLIAVAITLVYYFRNRKIEWMNNWLVILFIFCAHFFFFAWGVLIFILSEIIRQRVKSKMKQHNIDK